MANPKNVNDHVNLNGGFSGFNNPGAATFYVGETTAFNGKAPSDNNTGLSPQQAKATIQAALDLCVASRGDIVAVLPGEYTITAALTMTKADVTLCAAHPTVPHVQPSTSIVCATNSVGMLTVDAANCTVEGLRFDHNAGTAAINIIDVGATTASPGTTLRNLFIDMEGSATDTDGIELSNAVNSLIEGCTIHDYDQDGIIVDAGCDETVIRNCVIRDGVTANAGQYGISTVSDNSIIEDCTVQTDGTAGIYCNVGLLVHINRCYVFCTGANTLGIAAANTGTMSVKNCHITAMAAGNVVDFATSATVPSAVIAWEGIDGTDPTIGVLTTATVDGL